MIRVPLRARDGSVRAVALLDDQDAELAGLRWCLHSQGYAYRFEGRRPGRVCVLLHRAVMGLAAGDGRQVDHRDRNKLDCRRENLRLSTPALNAQNVPSRGGTSRFRGVHWYGGRWVAQTSVNGRRTHVGVFVDEVAAAVAAQARRREVMPAALPDPELVALGLA